MGEGERGREREREGERGREREREGERGREREREGERGREREIEIDRQRESKTIEKEGEIAENNNHRQPCVAQLEFYRYVLKTVIF